MRSSISLDKVEMWVQMCKHPKNIYIASINTKDACHRKRFEGVCIANNRCSVLATGIMGLVR